METIDKGPSGAEVAGLMNRLKPLPLQQVDPRLESLLTVDAPWPQVREKERGSVCLNARERRREGERRLVRIGTPM